MSIDPLNAFASSQTNSTGQSPSAVSQSHQQSFESLLGAAGAERTDSDVEFEVTAGTVRSEHGRLGRLTFRIADNDQPPVRTAICSQSKT